MSHIDDRSPEQIAERANIKIDWNIVDRFLESDCTGVEVANRIGMHPETLYRRTQEEKKVNFADYAASKKNHGNAELKKAQYEEALGVATVKGNTQLLLRLGETRLGQSKNATATTDPLELFRQLADALKRDGDKVSLSNKCTRSKLEDEQPLQYQDSRWKKDSVQDELGANRAMEESSLQQYHSESSSVGNDDLFLPAPP